MMVKGLGKCTNASLLRGKAKVSKVWALVKVVKG